MNYLLILLGGAASSVPNIDSLAANGRLGMIEGWDGLESLLQDEPAEEGNIKLTCGAASLDEEGNVSALLAENSDVQELAETISSIEVDGVKFQAEARGSDITLELGGEGLSCRIAPNLCAPGMPLAQVCASSKEGKKTTSILNKLIYRIAKKRGKTIFVKKVGTTRPLPDGFELMELNQDVDSTLLSRIKSSDDLVTIIIGAAEGDECAPVLIHGGGLLGGGSKKFCQAACSRGFRIGTGGLLPWVLRATSAQV